MYVLVPVDSSDSSLSALRFGAALANRFEGDLDVVHYARERTDATDELVERAGEICREAGLSVEPELRLTEDVGKSNAGGKVGERIIALAEERGYDHLVMGRNTSGRFERFVVGSASETVVTESDLPVTLVP
ncbi:universal stress protein [Natronorarus salvus]|uniref:universal stress protein n=1 Tax=Natronorarus salvus TaxID=3117733 RepID=UPI002F268C2F